MSDGLDIRQMSLEDLQQAVDWAAAEGWNPGLEDAETFHSVDPNGFLMGWSGGTPVSAISVVRHSGTFGFLGFYLCHPDHRGQGYGIATWEAGMAYLGDRTVGLDGVPAQEANYERSGFALDHYTRRHCGAVAGKVDPNCRLTTPNDLSKLLALDLSVNGTERIEYLSTWSRQTNTRKTMVYDADGPITAFGTIRSCQDGHKIGPLFAPDRETAAALIHALVAFADAKVIMIDVPDANRSGVELADALCLEPTFSCARMYRGNPLSRRLDTIFGETTFELG